MRPEETRSKILAASDELFGVLGFDATTTRDIAAKSGVNKALIHYHFGTKDELLAAVLEDYYARLRTTLLAALEAPGEPLAKLLAVVDAYGDFLARNHAFCSIVQREVASGRHMERIVAGTLPTFQLAAAWLGPIAASAPAGLELVQLFTSVYGMVVTYFTYGAVIQRLTGEDPFTPEALEARRLHVRRVVTLLFHEATRGAVRQ
jgi:AcrR family transcriptional regulator